MFERGKHEDIIFGISLSFVFVDLFVIESLKLECILLFEVRCGNESRIVFLNNAKTHPFVLCAQFFCIYFILIFSGLYSIVTRFSRSSSN